MPFQSAPLPTHDAWVDSSRRLTRVAIDWLTALIDDVDASPARLKVVELEDQEASIGSTSIPFGALNEGLYRVSVYARITRAATSSSSLTVAIGWTESSLSLSKSFSALTGNTTGTVLVDPPLLLYIDGSTPITYATTYASVGATAMQYRLTIVLEQINA